jgi:hypothetical protein
VVSTHSVVDGKYADLLARVSRPGLAHPHPSSPDEVTTAEPEPGHACGIA